MSFKLASKEAQVKEADISAYISVENGEGGLSWSIELFTEKMDFKYGNNDDEEIESRRAAIEYILSNVPEFSWKELGKQDFSSFFNTDPDEAEIEGGFLVFGHEDITESEIIKFSNRNGTEFDLHWKGKANIGFDEGEFDENVPFEIKTKIEFSGVIVPMRSNTHQGFWQKLFHPQRKISQKQAENYLKEFLPHDEFELQEINKESGHYHFKPIL